jgi:hypothetical protein
VHPNTFLEEVMPPPFQQLDLGEFAKLLARFPFERKITKIHLHHLTQRSLLDGGYATLHSIWHRDTVQLGLRDIAEHLSITLNGMIWTGRNWNDAPELRPPATKIDNGGVFSVRVLCNLDGEQGGALFRGAVRTSTVEVLAALQSALAIGDEGVLFHRDVVPKGETTCPGAALERQALLAAVAEARLRQQQRKQQQPAGDDDGPFGEEAEAWFEFITISTSTDTSRRTGGEESFS